MSDIYHEFRDRNRRLVVWFDRDRFNLFSRHNPHPEYDNMVAIGECLGNPDEIRKSSTHKRRLCFYRAYGTADGKSKTLKCVVEYRNRMGILITAFNAKPGDDEKIIWEKNQPTSSS